MDSTLSRAKTISCIFFKKKNGEESVPAILGKGSGPPIFLYKPRKCPTHNFFRNQVSGLPVTLLGLEPVITLPVSHRVWPRKFDNPAAMKTQIQIFVQNLNVASIYFAKI